LDHVEIDNEVHTEHLAQDLVLVTILSDIKKCARPKRQIFRDKAINPQLEAQIFTPVLVLRVSDSVFA
jgi:hypothetical protein